MRNLSLICWFFLGCVLAVPAGAQSAPQPYNPRSDWSTVERLAPGTPISIQLGHHWQHCAFNQADEEYIQCSIDPGPPPPIGILAPPMVYHRAAVRKIRLEKVAGSMALGLVIGAGAGAGLGALHDTDTTRAGNTTVGAAIGGLVGGLIGRFAPLVHGRVIYQR